MKKNDYLAPELIEFRFEAEAGFAGSDGYDYLGLPGEDPNENDYGDF